MSLQTILIDWRFLNQEYPLLERPNSLETSRHFFERLDQAFSAFQPKVFVLLPEYPDEIPGWQLLVADLPSLNLKLNPHFLAFGDIDAWQYSLCGNVLIVKSFYCDIFLLKGVFELGLSNVYSGRGGVAAHSPGLATSSGDQSEKGRTPTIDKSAENTYPASNIFFFDFGEEQNPNLTLERCYRLFQNSNEIEDTIIHPYGQEWPNTILPTMDASWTLFLDRDGVINHRIMGDYVKRPDEFVFLPGVKEAISKFSRIFGKIVVVTNQQGIGKGLMTPADLASIHQKMEIEVSKAGGRIDKIYHCPGLAAHQPLCRKPLPGMAMDAFSDFPEIDLSKSIMVGDSLSDIEFGRRLGMFTVKIGETCQIEHLRIDRLIDLVPFL
jgi:histidinol-phosphate phosphatase family protein